MREREKRKIDSDKNKGQRIIKSQSRRIGRRSGRTEENCILKP